MIELRRGRPNLASHMPAQFLLHRLAPVGAARGAGPWSSPCRRHLARAQAR